MGRINITLRGVDLTIVGVRTRAYRGNREEPDEPAGFEIERIEHEGDDFYHLLSDDALMEIDVILSHEGDE